MIERLSALFRRGDENLQSLLEIRLPDVFVEPVGAQLQVCAAVLVRGNWGHHFTLRRPHISHPSLARALARLLGSDPSGRASLPGLLRAGPVESCARQLRAG